MKGYINANTKIRSDNPNNPEILSADSISDLIARNVPSYIEDNVEVIRPKLNHYSLNEQIIGMWVDDTPVYQKTIITEALSSGTINIAHNIENLKRAWVYNGYFFKDNSSENWSLTADIKSSTGKLYIHEITPTNIVAYIDSGRSGTRLAITIQYTKTDN